MTETAPPKRRALRSVLVRIPATLGIPAALVLTGFLLGPRVQVDETVEPASVAGDPADWVARREASIPGIRPGDQAEVVWADPLARGRTARAVVYLHGFSADRHELDPVPARVAEALGANLLYTRLAGHGRDGAAMGEVTARAWFQDVADAVAVGRALGDEVILVGTSTGATLAVWAAARPELAGDLAALVLISPNFRPADANAQLLLFPWAGAIARAALGPERCFEPLSPDQARHWTTCYPVQALLPMMGLVERVRTLDHASVRVPTLVLYSPEDQVVDPRAIRETFELLGAEAKRLVEVEGGGPARHVLAGDIAAPENNDRLVAEVLSFLGEAADGPAPGGAETGGEGGS